MSLIDEINALARERSVLWLRAGHGLLAHHDLVRIRNITARLAMLWEQRHRCSDTWCCGSLGIHSRQG